MGWKGVAVMDLRVRFISDYLDGLFPVAELCRQFNISRKTGYKWIGRYEKFGVEGLLDLSTKPHGDPHKTAQSNKSSGHSFLSSRHFLAQTTMEAWRNSLI